MHLEENILGNCKRRDDQKVNKRFLISNAIDGTENDPVFKSGDNNVPDEINTNGDIIENIVSTSYVED